MNIYIKPLGILCLLLFAGFSIHAQKQLPSVNVSTLKNQQINVQSIQEEGKPMIVSFWATWCKPCISELEALNESIADWEEEGDFQMVAISIDDARSMSRIKSVVNGKAWEFDVYSDANSELKRSMGVNNIPHTFILDAQGNIIWQHASYNIGDEEAYLEVLRGLWSK